MGFLWSENGQPQGFCIGKVVNNYDKDHAGMVQVHVPAFKSEFNTMEWMRCLSPAAGGKNGFYFLPNVGDEVIIGFIDNDQNNPFVLGCLWNKDSYPDEAVKEKNEIKKIVTKSGIEIVFNEEEKKEQLQMKTPKGLQLSLADEEEIIQISDKDGNNLLKMDIKNKKILIKSAEEFAIEAKKIVIKGSDSVALESKAITVSASDKVELQGKSKLSATGGQVELKGSSSLSVSGAQVEIKASATLKAEGSAMAELKGGMVKING